MTTPTTITTDDSTLTVDPAATMTPEKEADLWAIEISPYGNCDFHAFVLIFSSGVEPSEKVIQRVFLRFTYTDTHSQSAFRQQIVMLRFDH